uniref:Autophagy protein 5 n=1 Tax=Romanomermis culicivorax TaxID=13658 RepID=A0A915HYT7_ROMCU
MSFLQQDLLAYAPLDPLYPILLFLPFGHYCFVPEVDNAPTLFPHDSLDAAKIDHLAQTLITTFHIITLKEVLPADAMEKVYLTISQITLPAIMGDEVLSAYHFFMYDCASSDHGQSFCLGTQPNGFRQIKTLTHTTHPKILTALKVPKKIKKQEDKWNKSPEVSDDEDPSLQVKSIFNDQKRLQAAITSAMKSRLMHGLIELLNFPVLPTYKLAIPDHIQFEADPFMLPISHEVYDVWIERVTADQLLHNRTHQGTHYLYLPNTIISLLQVDGEWFGRLTTSMLLAVLLASPCSATQ